MARHNSFGKTEMWYVISATPGAKLYSGFAVQSSLDYISGMTDIYALDLYRRITGMNLPAV